MRCSQDYVMKARVRPFWISVTAGYYVVCTGLEFWYVYCRHVWMPALELGQAFV